jgi:long-chain alkane monooxygenase
MSTLDHLTRGRVGWNIVTGYLDSAARGMGLAAQPDHDWRYDAADEYMSVVYQLWEASWEDGAVLRDKSNRIFADPAKIHRVRHQGRHYQVDAIHLAEPSPQRTPVLYQAGSSTRGPRLMPNASLSSGRTSASPAKSSPTSVGALRHTGATRATS